MVYEKGRGGENKSFTCSPRVKADTRANSHTIELLGLLQATQIIWKSIKGSLFSNNVLRQIHIYQLSLKLVQLKSNVLSFLQLTHKTLLLLNMSTAGGKDATDKCWITS